MLWAVQRVRECLAELESKALFMAQTVQDFPPQDDFLTCIQFFPVQFSFHTPFLLLFIFHVLVHCTKWYAEWNSLAFG